MPADMHSGCVKLANVVPRHPRIVAVNGVASAPRGLGKNIHAFARLLAGQGLVTLAECRDCNLAIFAPQAQRVVDPATDLQLAFRAHVNHPTDLVPPGKLAPVDTSRRDEE